MVCSMGTCMRVLLYLLIFSACTSSEFDSRIDLTEGNDPPRPKPSPTSSNQQPACLASCAEACEDYSSWSALTPATDTVCEGEKLTQSQSRTRTCQETCPEVKCLLSESKEVEATGSKDCTDPPPPCHASCDTGCQAKVDGAWSPTVSSQCKDEEFTQTQEWTRQCFPTCNDKKDCLCENIVCATQGGKERGETGTKEIDCEAACDKDQVSWQDWSPNKEAAQVCKGQTQKQTRAGTLTCPRDDCNVCATEMSEERTITGTQVTPCTSCTAWQAVTGDKGVWTPASNTVTKGQSFKQTRHEERTCNLACPDPDSPCATTMVAERNAVGTHEPPVAKAASEPPVEVVPSKSCADCEAWQEWGAWTVVASCPTTIAWGDKLPVASQDVRNRARTCNNVDASVGCFTSNSETRTTACRCPAGKVLAVDGTCVCDATDRQYRDGNVCKQCPSDYNFTQADGTWVCEQTCTCCSEWVEQSVSQQASNVCHNQQFAATYTYARMCDSCPAGNTCSTTKTDTATLQGTKTTTNCDEHCEAWSEWTWTAQGTCPAATLFEPSTLTSTGTKTRTCTGLCAETDCNQLDNTGHKTEDCAYCQGTGQTKDSEGKCACDASQRYYRVGDSCTLCPATHEFGNGICKACSETEELQDGVCVAKAVEPPAPTCSEEQELAEGKCVYKTCAAGCSEWNMSDWTWTLSSEACQDPASFSKPTLAAQVETRTRTRTCENLKAGLECFTSNTETRTTACHWCQGTGKEIVDGTCVCQHSSGYRQVGNECQTCPAGQVLVEQAGTLQCSDRCDDVCDAWQVSAGASWTPVASNVCAGETFTPTQPLERTCPAERSDCATTKTEQGTQATGTKTVVCDDACSAWSNWGNWVGKTSTSCPVTTEVVTSPTQTQASTRTRTCPAAQLCGVACATSETKTRTVNCPCTGEGQTRYMGECNCNTSGNFFINGNSCELCSDGNIEQQGDVWACVPPPQTAPAQVAEAAQETTPTCQSDCSGCDEWSAWTNWTADKACPATSSMTEPASDTIKSRRRDRTCGNLCAGVECFTANQETETCSWCQGEGQKKDSDGNCVCDRANNFHRSGDQCLSCGLKTVNATGTGCVCPESKCMEKHEERMG